MQEVEVGLDEKFLRMVMGQGNTPTSNNVFGSNVRV